MDIRKHPLYQIFAWLILLLGLGVLITLSMKVVTEDRWLTSDDYVEYWAAGRLNITGGNPYNPDELLPLQHQAGRYVGVPLMMWNPPWMLAIAMPFGALDYAVGRAIWLMLSIGIIIACSDIVWGFYGGPEQKRWLSWLIGLGFVPVLDGLRAGQTTVFMLLGVIGFLYFHRRGNNWFSGVFLSLLAIKPHILLIFAIAIVFWCIYKRSWSVIFGFLTVLITATLLSWVINPSVFDQYIYATTHYPPEEWATPTMGSVLRIIFGPENFWLQFVPPIVGIIWLIYYWIKNCRDWNWFIQAPLLTLVSMTASAYGWTFDQTIFILPIVSIFARLFRKPSGKIFWSVIISYLLIDVIDYLMRVPQIWLWWLAPSLLIWYLIADRWIADPSIATNPALEELNR